VAAYRLPWLLLTGGTQLWMYFFRKKYLLEEIHAHVYLQGLEG
jgi:hypothetical protein